MPRPCLIMRFLPAVLAGACSSDPGSTGTPGASFTITDQDGRIVAYSWGAATWQIRPLPNSSALVVVATGTPPSSAGSLSITELDIGLRGQRFQAAPADLELPVGVQDGDTTSVSILKLGGGAFALSGTVRIRSLADGQVRTAIAADFGTFRLDGTIVANAE